MCVMKPAITSWVRPSFFSVASRSVWANALGSGFDTMLSPPAGFTASMMAPPRASRSNRPPARPLCWTCTTGAPAARALASSRASASTAGADAGQRQLAVEILVLRVDDDERGLARAAAGRRSAPAISSSVLGVLMSDGSCVGSRSPRAAAPGPARCCGRCRRWRRSPSGSRAPPGSAPARTRTPAALPPQQRPRGDDQRHAEDDGAGELGGDHGAAHLTVGCNKRERIAPMPTDQ